MFNKKMRLKFISDWHIGSGLGSGAVADSILNRDANGLPYIPGRAIKGALREAAWRVALVGGRPDLRALVDILFGSAELAKFSNTSGKARVSMGNLAPGLARWLLERDQNERERFVGDLTVIGQQTALDDDRMVKPHSLRSIERGIPGLWFEFSISVDAPERLHGWLESYLACLFANVKSVGADRARGLGNCVLLPEGGAPARVSLPKPWPEIQDIFA